MLQRSRDMPTSWMDPEESLNVALIAHFGSLWAKELECRKGEETFADITERSQLWQGGHVGQGRRRNRTVGRRSTCPNFLGLQEQPWPFMPICSAMSGTEFLPPPLTCAHSTQGQTYQTGDFGQQFTWQEAQGTRAQPYPCFVLTQPSEFSREEEIAGVSLRVFWHLSWSGYMKLRRCWDSLRDCGRNF